MNDELIDFATSSTYRDSYYQQGLTRLPSPDWHNRHAPEIRPNGHTLGCVCQECWWGVETGSQSGDLAAQISRLWKVVQGMQKRTTSKLAPVRRRINE